MKILSIGLDRSILDKNSSLAKRAVEYGRLVQKYIVIAPAEEDNKIDLSDNVGIYSVKSKNKIIGLFKIYKLAKKIIKEENVNIISVQDQYYLGLISLMLARKFKKGLEIQVHGFEKYYGLRKIIAKYILPRADSVRVVSQRLKRKLIEEFGVKENKITVAPIYVNLSLRGANGAERNKRRSNPVAHRDNHGIASPTARNDKFIFLTVGRLVPVKNISMQIKAMAEVIKKYPNAELWIAGEGGERAKLEKLSYELRVTSYVRFLGWQDDLEKFYNQADVFLLTSNSEGWGMAVIEAAFYGLPIIMTDVGCAGEVIKDGESGIIIPISDQKKLEETMIKLIEDKDLRNRLGKNAQEAVKKLSGKEEILDLYKHSWKKAII